MLFKKKPEKILQKRMTKTGGTALVLLYENTLTKLFQPEVLFTEKHRDNVKDIVLNLMNEVKDIVKNEAPVPLSTENSLFGQVFGPPSNQFITTKIKMRGPMSSFNFDDDDDDDDEEDDDGQTPIGRIGYAIDNLKMAVDLFDKEIKENDIPVDKNGDVIGKRNYINSIVNDLETRFKEEDKDGQN
jgi:hypothetical protein